VPPLRALVESCRALGSPQDLAALQQALEAVQSPPSPRFLDSLEMAEGNPLRMLLAGRFSSARPQPAELIEALSSGNPALANAAALQWIELYEENPDVLGSLLVGPDPYTPPRLEHDARWYLVRAMGWSGDRRFVPVLDGVLRWHYHFHPPFAVAEALAALGAPPDPEEVCFDRSISITMSGSTLVVHEDPHFNGASSCSECRFFPCRVNRYFAGAIQDCQLWNRRDPETFYEMVDHRTNKFGIRPTPDLAGERREKLDRLLRHARESEKVGELHQAAEKLRLAVRFEESIDAQLALIARAVRLKVRAGESRGAYALLDWSDDKLRQATDEDIVREYEAAVLALGEELGGYVQPQIRHLQHEESKRLEKLYLRLRPPMPRERQELEELVRLVRQRLDGDDDTLHRHWWIRRFLSLCHALGESPESERWLDGLDTLPATHEHDELARDVARLRQMAYRGNVVQACARLRRLLPRVRDCRLPERRLEYYGDVLECSALAIQGVEAEPEPVLALRLAEKVRELFRRLLALQAGPPARRRLRERCQRSLEGTLLCLLRTAERCGVDGRQGQALLAEAWRLVMANRNPELQAPKPELDGEQAGRLRLLEDKFHRGLSHTLCGTTADWVYWQLPHFLLKVVDFEMSAVEALREPEEGSLLPPDSGTSVAFFLCSEILPSMRLLVIRYDGSGFHSHWVDVATELRPLIDWGRAVLEDRAREEVREFERFRQLAEAVSRDFFLPPWSGATPTLPDDRTLRELATGLLESRGARTGKDSADDTWYLFPDQSLNQLPFELLPSPDDGSPLCATRSIRYFLRSSPRFDLADRRVAPSGGWLGVGGIPEAPGFKALDGAVEEIRAIASHLSSSGYKVVESLTGPDAHLENVRLRLEKTSPSILHFACHGYADPLYPDACCLVLAVEPGGAAGELLPFRLIRQLPLAGVELVVLSACSSLVGPESMGAEGLAWAFLDAGAACVLASRSSVQDHATMVLMRQFYRFLPDRPVAEALRCARLTALTEHRLAPRDVGAWCLWE